MRTTRLAAAAIAGGTLVLGMAGPALANTTSEPKAGQFCKTADAKIGKTIKISDGTVLKCVLKAGHDRAQWVATSGKPTKPKPTPTKPTPTKPAFRFGFDKVQLSSRVVAPGKHTTFTVTCPGTVSITSNGYTVNPLAVKKTGKSTWTATGTFKSSLPDPTVATVVCKGYGSVKYSTHPAKKGGTSPSKGNGNTMTPTTPKVPTGRIDTGDGSMYGRTDGSPLMAAAWGALAAAGLGGVALGRRAARKRSSVA